MSFASNTKHFFGRKSMLIVEMSVPGGALAGTAVGYAVLVTMPNLNAWRWMFATAVVPALIVTIGRFYVTESANWLFTRGKTEQATLSARRLLLRMGHDRLLLYGLVVASGDLAEPHRNHRCQPRSNR